MKQIDSTRERILMVSAKLFAEKGYAGTSIREICARSKITKPTLYYHFGSKEGLACSMRDEAMARFNRVFQGTEQRVQDVPGLLGEIIGVHFRFFKENPDMARFLYSMYLSPQTALSFLEISKLSRWNYKMIKDRLNEAAQLGLVRDDFLEEIVALVRGAISYCVLRYMRGEMKAPSQEFANHLGVLIFEGAKSGR